MCTDQFRQQFPYRNIPGGINDSTQMRFQINEPHCKEKIIKLYNTLPFLPSFASHRTSRKQEANLTCYLIDSWSIHRSGEACFPT